MDFFADKAKKSLKAIVFPEGENPTIIKAAAQLQKEKLAIPILLGNPGVITENGRNLNEDIQGIEIIEPASSPLLSEYAAAYNQERALPDSVCHRIVSQPLYFGVMMVKRGQAYGMVAGIAHPTEEVIIAGELIIGLQAATSVSSSFYLVDIPGYSGSQGSLLIFADPAVNPDPDPGQLADIAVTTARSARELLHWEPRVAMLSFSTKGSASHVSVDKVAQAVELARKKAPDLLIDGEMQADAALVESVAVKKMGPGSPAAGRANILIFPSLDAANISSKLVQQLAGAKLYGPILQGFQKPISDLSRSATIQDVVGTALLAAAKG